MSTTIRTNNVPRLLLDWNQLTPTEQREFDYLSDEYKVDRDFVRYKGSVYDLGEMQAVTSQFPTWHGYNPDSYFSGILVKWPNRHDTDHVVMATYYS